MTPLLPLQSKLHIESPSAVFCTWRLCDTLPPRSESVQAKSGLTESQRFLAEDRVLDQALTGPVWFENPLVAESIVDTLLIAEREWELCRLLAWVVMPNHLHILMEPRRPLHEASRVIRKNAARAANEILGRPGKPFWYEDSDDYWIKDGGELERVARYVEANPVTAGLAARREQWHWSSAYPRLRGKTEAMYEVSLGLLSPARALAGPTLAA